MDTELSTSMRVIVTGSIATHAPKKTAKLFGKDFSVFPSTMMVVGGHYPKVERATKPTCIHFSERALQQSVNTWNGRPVSINHPENQITCNSPDTYNRQWVGYVFNAKYDKPNKSLKSELWIDNERGKIVNDLVESGQALEVSIGVFGELQKPVEKAPYDFTMGNIVGDHLAILPNSKGACSWEDGCGIRAEAYKRDPTLDEPVISAQEITEPINIEMRGEEMEECQEKVTNNESQDVQATRQVEKTPQTSVRNGSLQDCESKFDKEEWWNQAPSEFRSYLMNSMKTYDRQREGYINKITSCKAAVFCEKALNSLEDMSILEGISDLVDAVMDVGKAPQRGIAAAGNYQFQAAGSTVKAEKAPTYATFKDIDYVELEKERQELERVRRVRNG